jgi:octaprenyl-diphosphate synthase
MSLIDNINAPIKEEMKNFEPFFRASLKSNVPLLSIITNYILRRKGKQMRPMLVFLSAKLFNNVNEKTYTAASLIELLHTATLVHDDVVDSSHLRRGFFSINALWKSKIAVLVGDFLLSKGLLISVENEAFDLLKIVSEAMKEMAEGELIQIEKARKLNITEDIYFQIISKKTATLIASCSASGAKSAGCDEITVNQMKNFGINLGIAFQIKDDLFDYQNKSIIGKPTGNDIQEKKMTLPLIHALDKSDYFSKRKILKIIRKDKKSQNDILTVVKFVTENGGIDYSLKKMMEFKTNAENIIFQFPDNEAKKSLLGFVNYAVEREK